MSIHPLMAQALRPFAPKPQTLSVHPSIVDMSVEVLKGQDMALIYEAIGPEADKDDAIPALVVEVLEASSPREQDLALQHLALKLTTNALAYIEAVFPLESAEGDKDETELNARLDTRQRARDMNATRPLAYI